MNPEIEINVEQQGLVTIFDVKGDVTAFADPVFKEAYEKADEQGTSKILLKFYEDAYFNSGGIAVLIQLLAKTKRNNQKLFITGISDHFDKIFNMVGITKFAKIYATVEAAIADIA